MAGSPHGEKHCVYCRRPESEVGRLSGRGNCKDCGIAAAVYAAESQARKEGPVWERRCLRSAQAAQRELKRLRTAQAA